MENKVITLRGCFGKIKEYHFQPCKMPNGSNYPFVKKVRYDAEGNAEMILSPDELNNPESNYFIPEDLDIVITDGTTFDLNDPYQRNVWNSIKDSDLIVPMRDARDANGNLLIDGDRKRYGIAELWVDVPGEEAERSVSKKQKINKAWTFIGNDSTSSRLTKARLLGRDMRHSPDIDVQDFLYQKAENNPDEIIELYTSSDIALRLLLLDARDRNIVLKKNGTFMYGESILGPTEDAVLLFLKMPSNVRILDALKFEVYPEYAVMKKGVEEELPRPISTEEPVAPKMPTPRTTKK